MFTEPQRAAAAQNLQDAIDRLTSARTTLLAAPGTQFPVTTAIRAAIEKQLDTLLLCGAAIED